MAPIVLLYTIYMFIDSEQAVEAKIKLIHSQK